jgi:hypothetical protein
MSRAPRIDDHKSWMGTRSKGSVFPDGPHKTKEESSAEGAGGMGEYDDTTDDIKRDQNAGIGKLNGRRMKPGYRN